MHFACWKLFSVTMWPNWNKHRFAIKFIRLIAKCADTFGKEFAFWLVLDSKPTIRQISWRKLRPTTTTTVTILIKRIRWIKLLPPFEWCNLNCVIFFVEKIDKPYPLILTAYNHISSIWENFFLLFFPSQIHDNSLWLPRCHLSHPPKHWIIFYHFYVNANINWL